MPPNHRHNMYYVYAPDLVKRANKRVMLRGGNNELGLGLDANTQSIQFALQSYDIFV